MLRTVRFADLVGLLGKYAGHRVLNVDWEIEERSTALLVRCKGTRSDLAMMRRALRAMPGPDGVPARRRPGGTGGRAGPDRPRPGSPPVRRP
jgi:hypothetical protein